MIAWIAALASAGMPLDNIAISVDGRLWVLGPDRASIHVLEGDRLREHARLPLAGEIHLHRMEASEQGGLRLTESSYYVGDDGQMPDALTIHHLDPLGGWSLDLDPPGPMLDHFGAADPDGAGGVVRTRFGQGLERVTGGTVETLLTAGTYPGAWGERATQLGRPPHLSAVAASKTDAVVWFVDTHIGGLWRLEEGEVSLVLDAPPGHRMTAVEVDLEGRLWVGWLDREDWTLSRLDQGDIVEVASLPWR